MLLYYLNCLCLTNLKSDEKFIVRNEIINEFVIWTFFLLNHSLKNGFELEIHVQEETLLLYLSRYSDSMNRLILHPSEDDLSKFHELKICNWTFPSTSYIFLTIQITIWEFLAEKLLLIYRSMMVFNELFCFIMMLL